MKILGKYSHLYGQEYLAVRKAHQYAEIEHAVSTIYSQTLRGRNYVGWWKSFNDWFQSTLQGKGWKSDLSRSFGNQRANIGTLLLAKNAVGVIAKPRTKIENDIDLFAVYPWLYTCGTIDVVIVITPSASLACSFKGDKTRQHMICFEEFVHNLEHQPRNNPTVPLLVLGVG